MASFNSAVTARIRAELDDRSITQHDAAARLGWHQSYLSRRLTGAVPWTTDDIEQVAGLLDLAPWQLVTNLIA